MPKVQSFDHEKGGHSRRGRRTSTSLAEINVVPLVDVMLVLLIIFMVTAPMMQRGLEIQLPVAKRVSPSARNAVYVTLPLSYRKDKLVAIGPLGRRSDSDRRARRTDAAGAGVTPDQTGVFLRMDDGVNAQEFLNVYRRLERRRRRDRRHRRDRCDRRGR